jgi:serine/threonine protein kinase
LGKHAQIPQLFAHFSENNQFYLVQEYIEGHPLGEETILGKQWEEIAVIEFLEDVLSTLAFVHQHNVIHRDIKPDNLIRRKRDNKIILIDFGAVKQIINLSNPQNQPKTIGIGTPGYMSNEQNLGKPTFSSDIYSVGMIAIQMLTGYYPTQLVDSQTGEIHWQNKVKTTPKFTDILVKMSHPDFQQRYPSATEALQAIQGLQGVSPTIAPTVSMSHSSSIQNKGGKIAVIPLILMLLLGGVIGIGVINLSERQQNNETQHQPAF